MPRLSGLDPGTSATLRDHARPPNGRGRARRLAALVAGWTLLAAGGALLVLPGPGIPLVLAGLALLGRELRWARRAHEGLVARLRRARDAALGRRGGGVARGRPDAQGADGGDGRVSARYAFEQVTTFERLAELREPWAALWARAPAATPFSSPWWLVPWCRHLASGPPWSVAVWRGRALAGLAPTFVHARGGGRVLGLLGSGVSDYQDLLAEDAAAAGALLAYLAAPDRPYDGIELRSLPADALALGRAQAVGAALALDDVCPIVRLPDRPADLGRRASGKLLADVRHQRRRLARRGPLETLQADAGSWRSLLGELFRLHAARREDRGVPGMVAGEGLRRFRLEAGEALHAAGLLRVTALRSAGEVIGALEWFAAGGRGYCYLQGVAPEAAPYGPDNLLVAAVAEQAIAEGARELDLLRGREAYKYRWGAEDRPTFRLDLHVPAPSPPVGRELPASQPGETSVDGAARLR